MEKKKTDEYNEKNQQYEDLKASENESKDENTQTMKKRRLNHM